MPCSSILVVASRCGSCFLDTVDLLLQRLMIGDALHVFVLYMIERAGKKTARTAGRVHNGFAEFRINAIHHKASDGAWV